MRALMYDYILGQYLYLDGGITEESPNASLARLYSPVYAAKYRSAACFSFWYHIFGDEEFGTLGKKAIL